MKRGATRGGRCFTWAAVLAVAALPGAGCSGGADPGLDRPDDRAARRPAEAPASIPIVTDCPEMPVKTRDGLLRATPAAAGRSLDSARSVLQEQIARYPARFLRLVGLKELVLCGALSFEGTDCGAFADVERGRLYLQLADGASSARLRRTVHHEIFHQVDYADDHRLDADARWEALNPPGFRYTQDSLRVQSDPDALLPDSSLKGFVNLYATSGVAEDKAETYALMVVDPALIDSRAALDPIIRAKTERTRTIVDDFGPYSQTLFTD